MMNQKKTKIIATIGPASESPEKIETLIRSGVNIFRFNLKHNDYEWHRTVMERVRKIAQDINVNIGIMADLQGPELRIGNFSTGNPKETLEQDQIVYVAQNLNNTSHKELTIEFPKIDLVEGIEKNGLIMIDDGKVVLRVIDITSNEIKTIVEDGDILGTRKSVSIPNANINVPTLMEKDLNDVEFSVKQNVDFLALSFVRNAEDIRTLRDLINKHKGRQHIVAKIETAKAIEEMKEIIEETDALMVARGDLGVEIPIEKVPSIQEYLINLSREKAKPVIVATQMLLSMVENPIPSRAEVSDIAHSVGQGTDCLMLSEETTTGKYPVKAVSSMAKIAKFNENRLYKGIISYDIKSFEDVIIDSARNFSELPENYQQELAGYLVFTESGKSARLLSRYRPNLPIYVFTPRKETYHQLSMSYGIRSFNMELDKNPVLNIKNALNILKKENLTMHGDKLITIFGNNVGEPGGNNSLSLVDVD